MCIKFNTTNRDIEDITCPSLDTTFGLSVQVDFSRASAANERDIDLNMRRLKFLSTSGHAILVYRHR